MSEGERRRRYTIEGAELSPEACAILDTIEAAMYALVRLRGAIDGSGAGVMDTGQARAIPSWLHRMAVNLEDEIETWLWVEGCGDG
jgi:hypothetical protein